MSVSASQKEKEKKKRKIHGLNSLFPLGQALFLWRTFGDIEQKQ